MPVTLGPPSAGDAAREAASTDGRGKDRANRPEAGAHRPTRWRASQKPQAGMKSLCAAPSKKARTGGLALPRQQHAEADWRAVKDVGEVPQKHLTKYRKNT